MQGKILVNHSFLSFYGSWVKSGFSEFLNAAIEINKNAEKVDKSSVSLNVISFSQPCLKNKTKNTQTLKLWF